MLLGRGLTQKLPDWESRGKGVVPRKACLLISSPAECTEIHSFSQPGFLNVSTTAVLGWIILSLRGGLVHCRISSCIPGLYPTCQQHVLLLSWCDRGLQICPCFEDYWARKIELATMPSSRDTIPFQFLSGCSSKSSASVTLSTPLFLTYSWPDPPFTERPPCGRDALQKWTQGTLTMPWRWALFWILVYKRGAGGSDTHAQGGNWIQICLWTQCFQYLYSPWQLVMPCLVTLLRHLPSPMVGSVRTGSMSWGSCGAQLYGWLSCHLVGKMEVALQDWYQSYIFFHLGYRKSCILSRVKLNTSWNRLWESAGQKENKHGFSGEERRAETYWGGPEAHTAHWSYRV